MPSEINDTLVLRVNATDYFFPSLKEGCIYPCFKSDINNVERALRRFCSILKIPSAFTFSDWRMKVKFAKRVILFDYGYNNLITKYIKAVNSNCFVHLYCFNVMTEEFRRQSFEDKNIDFIWSFDYGDVEKYGVHFNSSMYTLNLFREPINRKEKKVVFVGSVKNRESNILRIKNIVEAQGGKTDFHIIRHPNEYISYNNYLSMIENSDCILDVTKEGQRGLTLRFMESLFLSKKIITNNIEVKKQKFYNSNNVFVIGVDSDEDLKTFFKTDYAPVPKEIIEYYDFETWKERFMEVEHA